MVADFAILRLQTSRTWLLDTAVALSDHLLRSRGMAVLHPEDVDAEHALEVIRRELEERFDLRDAGVGDPFVGTLLANLLHSKEMVIKIHRIQRPQRIDARPDDTFDLTQDRDIPQRHGGLPAEL